MGDIDSYSLLGMFFSGMAATLGSVFIARNKTKDVSITTTLAGVCNIVIHLVMLNRCKLFAASISTMISFGLLFAYRYIFVNRFFKVEFDICKVLPHILFFILAWVGFVSKNTIVILTGFVINLISIVCLLLQNKDVIIALVKRRK